MSIRLLKYIGLLIHGGHECAHSWCKVYMYIWVMWSAKVIEMLIEDDSKIADRKSRLIKTQEKWNIMLDLEIERSEG